MTPIENDFDNLKAYFQTDETKGIKFRKKKLKQLAKSIKAHERDLLDALQTDLGKNKVEAFAAEIGFTLHNLRHIRKELPQWAKTKQVNTPVYLFPVKSYIYKEPLGTIGIFSPFNYPVQLTFEPLIGAIAAGNTAMVKPSELTPNVANVIKEIIEETFEPNYVKVVLGDGEVAAQMSQLPFDHIFFTGSQDIGRKVYEAASRNLTPVTLELGGKSPVIVDETANIKVASERICFGKFVNAGQTCVAPDYVLVQRNVKDDLIKAIRSTINEFYGKHIATNKDYGRIVNDRHFMRLNQLLEAHRDKIILGGDTNRDDRFIEPTVLDHVTNEDEVIASEIFGPILPLVTYDELDEAIQFVKSKDKPLALYLFSEDENATNRVLKELSFGGGAINDTLLHLANHNLPFGGVGGSGFGRYHGKYTFDTFTHEKSYIFKTTRLDSGLLFPPYKGKFSYIKRFLKK